MAAVDEKKLELIKKLKALAEQGVGGEKTGAQQKMEQLMKKYGIEDMDISDEKLEDHDFNYKTEFEKRLLRQIFYKIVPEHEKYTYTYRSGKGKKSLYGITCTKAQAIQIEVEYEFYRELWKEEQEMFFLAYIQKHKIFGESTRKSSDQEDAMSRQEILRMSMMMDAMQSKTAQPLLEG